MPITATKGACAHIDGRTWNVKKGDVLDDAPKAVQAAFLRAGVAKVTQERVQEQQA